MRPILASDPELAAARLFGSAARGELRPDSSVDVGVIFREKGRSSLTDHRLLGDLASRLEQVTAPRSVDVVVLSEQGAIFAHNALVEGKLILEADRERRVDFETDTVLQAFDFRPTWEIARSGQIEAMRRYVREQLRER